MSTTGTAPQPQQTPDLGLLKYNATPTLSRFHHSNAYFRGVMGPIGTGKSVGCCWEIFMRGLKQKEYRGVRKIKVIVIRSTYEQLISTTLQTWKDWFGGLCDTRESPTVTSRCYVPLPDGTRAEMQLDFLAMDKPDDVKKIFSREATLAWINEASTVSDVNLVSSLGRPIGRYPSMREGGPTYSGIIADTNPPSENHWWYEFAEIKKYKGYEFFRQPGALLKDEWGEYRPNPLAENIENLAGGYDYYFRQLPGKSDQWIRIYLMGEYGLEWTGQPVYDMFNEKDHVATEPIEVIWGLPIYLGWDFGLTPAVVACQYLPNGQFRILREFCSEGKMGILQHVEQILRPALIREFPQMVFIGIGDPSGAAGSQLNKDVNCFTMLESLGYPAHPARTNDFVIRREAVIHYLNMRGGMLIDPSCVRIINGFKGGYKFDRVQVRGEENRFHSVPQKNEFSHPHDALQYVCLELQPVFVNARGRDWSNMDLPPTVNRNVFRG